MDQAAITKALTEARAIIDEALPWELSAGARNHSAADRTELRKTALKVILETLLRQTQGLIQENGGDVLLTPGQVAGIFAVSTRDVAEYADWGILNPVFTTGGKRLYRKSEVESVLAMSPEERNARRNPVTDVSGEDIERMRTDEGLTWSQIARRTGLGRTPLMTRHRKWLFMRTEEAARDEDGHSASGPHTLKTALMEDIARMRTQDGLSWQEVAVKTGLSRTAAQRRFTEWATRQLAVTEGLHDSQPAR